MDIYTSVHLDDDLPTPLFQRHQLPSSSLDPVFELLSIFSLQHVPLFIGSALKVNRVFFIPPESFEVKRLNGETVSIVPPCSWSSLAPVQVRLLSYAWRKGQVFVFISVS